MRSEVTDLLNRHQYFLVLVLRCENAVFSEQYSLSLNVHTYSRLFGLHCAGVRMQHSLVVTETLGGKKNSSVSCISTGGCKTKF